MNVENLDRLLEAAVVVSWPDLTRGVTGGLVHVEYNFSQTGGLDSLQVWSSARRGYWLLACSYWMSASKSHTTGVHFDNGFRSEGLAHNLAVVMQHQDAFTLHPNLGGQRVLQITTPTEAESLAAAASMTEAVTATL